MDSEIEALEAHLGVKGLLFFTLGSQSAYPARASPVAVVVAASSTSNGSAHVVDVEAAAVAASAPASRAAAKTTAASEGPSSAPSIGTAAAPITAATISTAAAISTSPSAVAASASVHDERRKDLRRGPKLTKRRHSKTRRQDSLSFFEVGNKHANSLAPDEDAWLTTPSVVSIGVRLCKVLRRPRFLNPPQMSS